MLNEERLVIWPRGSILFSINFCAVPLQKHLTDEEDWDSVMVALRLLYYYFYNNRTRKIT